MKRILLILIFIFKFPLFAMAMEPGTIIDPLNARGQFTVSALNPDFKNTSNSIKLLDASSDLIAEKGTPVIITMACSKLPWWALATGTGYVLIRQMDGASAHLYNSLMSGSSYALIESCMNMLNDSKYSDYVKYAIQSACAIGALGLNYASYNILLKEYSITTLQVIALSILNNIASSFYEPVNLKQALNNPELTSQERIKLILDAHPLDGYNLILKPYLTAAGIIFGGITMTTPAVAYSVGNYLKNSSLVNSALLTESAYRLTKQSFDFCKSKINSFSKE
jgi:hypothetical protein